MLLVHRLFQKLLQVANLIHSWVLFKLLLMR
ncbi:hypothetical protein BRC2024_FNJIJEUR_CDS_0055 [Acinetobacter phage vB_AbaP_Tama]